MIPHENLGRLEQELDDDIQRMYDTFFEDGWIYKAENLKEASGIGPNEKTLQEGYMKVFKRRGMTYARELKRFSGIGPTEEITQKGYLIIPDVGVINAADELKELSGFGPTEETVQETYSTFFKRGLINHVKRWEKFSETKPDFAFRGMKQAVQNGYLTLFEKNDRVRSHMLNEYTGISPSPELLKKYQQYAKEFGDSK